MGSTVWLHQQSPAGHRHPAGPPGRGWLDIRDHRLCHRNLHGDTLTRKDRLFWDNELDSLVAVVGGVNADSTPLAKAEENLRQTARIKGGANWFD